MIKIQKSIYIIFISILIQTSLGLSLGFGVLYFSSHGHIASNVFINDVPLGNLDKEEAVKKIDDMYKSKIANKSLLIEYGSNKGFEIKYSDIDAVLDSNATVNAAFGKDGLGAFANLLTGCFSSDKNIIYPVILFNEGKLREKLNNLAILIDKEPLDAELSIIDGKIVKKNEINGVKLNIENAIGKVRSEIGKNIGGNIAFKEADNYEIETIAPRYTMRYLDGLDEIISQYSTGIKNLDAEDSIIQAASSINRVLLLADDPKRGQKAGVFSFNKYLLLDDAVIGKNDEGYNQVASTLYVAALEAGIDFKSMSRTPHKNTVDYIKPGFDAIVISNTYDFKFENTLNSPLMILAEVQDDILTVRIIGKKKPTELTGILETEITQKFSPTVEYLENQNMATGKKRMVSPGKEGVTVKVYKVTPDGNKKYLYKDKYDAIKATVEIGPDTKWGEEAVK